MPLRFEPPKQVARYALFIDHGNGRGFFKTYDNLGSAKSALAYRNGLRYHRAAIDDAKILEMVDGEWYTLHNIPAGTQYQYLPWVKEVDSWRYSSSRRAVPMTRDEYADWRIKVEHEKLGLAKYEN